MGSAMTEPVRTCPGYCCFDLGPIRLGDHHLTLDEVRELAQKPEEHGARLFLEMLIPLGKDSNGSEHFSCNFFDTEMRSCTIYEKRPKMCRNYPAAHQRCPFCTYDLRQPHVPGVLHEELKDPARLQALIERVKR